MTPKEKAIELVESMSFSCRECDYKDKAKQCALILINAMIVQIYNIDHQHRAVYNFETNKYHYSGCKELLFWKEVKKEIKKL